MTNKIIDNNIKLELDTHTYKLVHDPTAKFISSTTFIHHFFEPFEKEKVAENLINNVPKYKDMTKEELFTDWGKSASLGTEIHEQMEDFILTGEKPDHPKGRRGAEWVHKRVDSKYILLPEVIIYSTKIGIAGMIDLLVEDPDTNEYVIIDWKTNKQIRTTAYKSKTGSHPATADIEDCNFMQYSLQLSLYRYILESYYNVKIKNCFIVHLKDDTAVEYKCPYLKTTIEKMLEAKYGIKF